MRAFVRFPRAVSREFRELHMDCFPALAGDTEEATALRRLAEYAEFGSPRWNQDGVPELLCSRRIIEALAGRLSEERRFSAERLIERFSEAVYPLHPSGYRYSRGEARMIRPAIPEAVQEAKRAEVSPNLRPSSQRVDFVSGKRLTSRGRRAALKEYRNQLEESAETDPNHPGRDLLRFLNSQPSDIIDRLVRKLNATELYDAWSSMPVTNERERQQSEAVFRVLATVQDFPSLVYREAERTPRLHAQGNTIHNLPRRLRRLALKPAFSLDLKACQLAVVARLWRIERLEGFLRASLDGGPSIWQELLGYLDLDASYKPLVKLAIYPIIFGMKQQKVRARLAHGVEGELGIGSNAADRFMAHPLIADLLEARGGARAVALRAGGVEDAFGRWIPCGLYPARSVLAQQAQSYELRLMLSLLPFIRAAGDIRVVSFLHDGLTVWVTDRIRSRRKLDRMCEVVRTEAARLGLATELEMEE